MLKYCKVLKINILLLVFFSFRTISVSIGQKKHLGAEREGLCSYYADKFIGRATYSGELYDSNLYTAAHKYLPMNTILAVFNLKSGRYIIVRVNDRGPHRKTRLIDISGEAANELGIKKLGIAKVKIKVLGFNGFQSLDPIDPEGDDLEQLNNLN
jgi:rare lipoprotein A